MIDEDTLLVESLALPHWSSFVCKVAHIGYSGVCGGGLEADSPVVHGGSRLPQYYCNITFQCRFDTVIPNREVRDSEGDK